jgi:SH3-like domain-containing protein
LLTRSLKTLAIAAVAILGTASASFAAQYAWVDQDANVKFKPHKAAMNVNWVEEGQKVKIIGQSGNWVKVQIPGKDGWVRQNVLGYSPFPAWGDDYDYGYGGASASFCLGGPNASFCVSN